MAKSKSQSISNGDLNPQSQSQRKIVDVGTDRQPRKNTKKPAKGNITNKVKSNGQFTVEDGQGDEEEGDSSAIEEQKDTLEDPDVFTLPGAQQLGVGEDGERLAGYEIEDDMFKDMPMIDEFQAVLGAELEADGHEDDYADVEDVSDSEASDEEDDEPSILRSAEQDLIDEFERNEQRRDANIMTMDMHGMAIDENDALAQPLNLQLTENELANFGIEINMNDDPFFGLARNDNLYNDMWDEAESAIWRMPETVRWGQNSDSNGTQKRVRFEETEVRESSSSSSEDPNEAFPDLFAASDDPVLKQRLALAMEQDVDAMHGNFDDAESFYDFEDEDERLAFELDEKSDSDSDSSGYTSNDEGDTTDDESREEQLARLEERKQAAGRPVDSKLSTPTAAKRAISTAASAPSSPRPSTPKTGKGLRSGTFAIDPTRATMTTDSDGRKIKLLPPAQPLEKDRAFWERAKTANNSRNNSPSNSTYLTIPSPAADNIPSRPFTAQSTLGSMFNGNLDILRNNDVSGIAEDLFPAMTNSRQTSFTSATTDDSETDRQDVNMQDFIDLDASDSDSDLPPSAPITSPTEPDDFGSTNTSGLLDHFDQCRGVVGSFRRNQHQVKHFSSLASHPAKRASAHEFNALQKGKRGAANIPTTPARKKRASQDLSANSAGVRKSIYSPFTSRRPRSRGNPLVQADLLQTLARNPFD